MSVDVDEKAGIRQEFMPLNEDEKPKIDEPEIWR